MSKLQSIVEEKTIIVFDTNFDKKKLVGWNAHNQKMYLRDFGQYILTTFVKLC